MEVRSDLNEMRWNQKGESKLDSNHFLMCATQFGSLRDVHGVIQRREEGGRKQRWPGGKGSNQKERDRSSR